MRTRILLLTLFMSTCVVMNTFNQDIPLVYDVENTGADCPEPPLPTFEELPFIEPLTDPFEWSDGSGRDTTFASWRCRRAEIKAEIEKYEIGPKPVDHDTLFAGFNKADSVLTVHVIKNDDTLTLTSKVIPPAGDGPFPAVIGIGFGSGSLPSDIFTSRDIAMIPFNYWQVMAHTQSRGNEPINRLYPELVYMGAYSAWSWGVSRLIDGLELVSDDLPIDLKHMAVTGCSFAGKMALFAGAFDERIALTIAQESGGGGAAAWRVSQTLEGVENLGNTNHSWFIEDMFQFSSKNVSKLPHDHHELMAMVAPRALFVLGNPDYVWLADESGYVSCEAAKRVWDNFNISDRFGFSISGGHTHCGILDFQKTEIEAFVDKFLLGDTLVNTNIETHPYSNVNPVYWYDWWGKGEPYFPVIDRGESEEVWFEAECATVGAAWNIRLDTTASNESYTIPKQGLTNNITNWPADSGSLIYFPFTVHNDTTFYVFGRVNCSAYDTYSFWRKLDDKSFERIYGDRTNGWKWIQFSKHELTAGEHIYAIGYRQNEAMLDKICISDFRYPPGETGEPAEFLCTPDTTTQFYSSINMLNVYGSWTLGQNYPNPFKTNTTIAFEIPRPVFVSLKVYSVLGEEIAELAGKKYNTGKHIVEFDARKLPRGVYFYTLKADRFSASQKMIIKGE
ncbi:MAG: T9SS type A sorting domain-containing protein [Bacteroidales bacterium]|nr:T9SS type A sorting domain-containing protein [Bacteroidales bacterium]MBN2764384.1 T9SS type A sorting domain-containing protein [Bacteroidales bacterium]